MRRWRKWHTDIPANRQLKPSKLRWAGYVEHVRENEILLPPNEM